MSRPVGMKKVVIRCVWCRKPNFERGHYLENGHCVECIENKEDGKIYIPDTWIKTKNDAWIIKEVEE